MFLQACLNGDREAPEIPRSPEELAAAARACVAAGAVSIHCHPRDADGHETLDAEVIGAAVRALRSLGVELSVSTGIWITAGDVDARLRAVSAWTDRPDLVSLNFTEEGWPELAEVVVEHGIRIEAGVWTPLDAETLARSGLASGRHPAVRRVLVEPRSEKAPEAVQLAAELDAALDAAGVSVPRLHHGEGPATWAVLDAAAKLGRELRIGFEDVMTLPDGRRAPDNAALVVEAVLRYS
jgi:uncharacterized protein (DUF849 family)